MIELSRSKKTYLGLSPEGRKRWAVDCAIQALQFRENSGPWQDIDPAGETPDTGGFTIKTTGTPYLGRIGDDSHRRIYPDRTDLSYWIQLEKPFASMPAPTRLNRWFYWDFTNALIGIRFDNASVKFAFRLKNAGAPTSITIPFSTQGLTRTGRFLYHNGQPVAELRKPVAVDANNEVKPCDITFGVGEVTISLDTTGLIFPLDNAPTIDVDVGASTDDADETFTGLVNLTRYYTISKSGGAAASRYWTGWRFTSGGFPVLGDTIDVAYIDLYIQRVSYDDIQCDLYFEKSGAAPGTFTSGGSDITNRVKTTAAVNWNKTNMGSGSEHSPSLVAPLQEVIDNYSPTALVVLLYPLATFDRQMRANAYDPPGSTYTSLHIEWTAGGGGSPAQVSQPMGAKMIAGKMI